MSREKNVLPIVLLILCALLVGTPAMAGPKRVEVPRASIEVPLGHTVDMKVPADKKIDLATYRFELDGATYSLEELNAIEGRLSIHIDEEGMKRGVARVSRINEQFESMTAESCSNVTAKSNTASCVFYNVVSCGSNWTRRLTVTCGYLVGNISWTVRSFRLGCGYTCILGNADCTGTGSCYTGAAGTCYNVTSGTVRCAGCFH